MLLKPKQKLSENLTVRFLHRQNDQATRPEKQNEILAKMIQIFNPES